MSEAVDTLFPPIVDGMSKLILSRIPGVDIITILMPNGDSYDLDADQVRRYLVRMMGMDEERCEDALRILWNFYGVVLQPGTGTSFWLPEDEVFIATELAQKG